MHRIISLFCLLLLCPLLGGCERQPDLAGRWETSADETLRATVLWLNGDNTFTHISEGRSTEGTWALKDDRLILTITPLHKMDSGGMFACTLDRTTGTILTHDGLHLYRQPDPDVVGYWMTYADDTPKRVSLHLMDSGLFALQIYDRDLPADTLDGWEEYHTGRWSLSGSLLTLRCDGRSRRVLTYRLNGDASHIETDTGILLKNYMRP